MVSLLKVCSWARAEGRETTQTAKWPVVELLQLAVVIISCRMNLELSNECMENIRFNNTEQIDKKCGYVL